MPRKYIKKEDRQPGCENPNLIEPKSVGPEALTKGELLGLYYQNKSTIEHMEHHMEKLNEDIKKSVDDSLQIQRDYTKYSARVMKVIQEMERNHKQKLQTIFSTVSNLQTLLTPPNYDFPEEEEKENAI